MEVPVTNGIFFCSLSAKKQGSLQFDAENLLGELLIISQNTIENAPKLQSAINSIQIQVEKKEICLLTWMTEQSLTTDQTFDLGHVHSTI